MPGAADVAALRTSSVLLPVLAALALRVVLGIMAWEPGWSALTWDDFTRVELALDWAQRPSVAIGRLVWLPLHTWVLGTAFLLTGGLFGDSPMALAAVVNSLAVLGAAGLVGRAAWHLFGSSSGALLAFAAILFSPWGFYVSLSGHSEGLYYLAVALTV
ncbi:MAG: hypothetical protein M3N51_12185, partial [Actinomycetota bacterium]|nr:hypothetical protein [Actinomycetota bacterium]